MAVGDFDFVRESLIGQAQWASVLAVKLAAEASGEDRIEKSAPLYKLAKQAQRQASQALATAAALNKLVDADSVTVGGGVFGEYESLPGLAGFIKGVRKNLFIKSLKKPPRLNGGCRNGGSHLPTCTQTCTQHPENEKPALGGFS
jgi:hypothetical protein